MFSTKNLKLVVSSGWEVNTQPTNQLQTKAIRKDCFSFESSILAKTKTLEVDLDDLIIEWLGPAKDDDNISVGIYFINNSRVDYSFNGLSLTDSREYLRWKTRGH